MRKLVIISLAGWTACSAGPRPAAPTPAPVVSEAPVASAAPPAPAPAPVAAAIPSDVDVRRQQLDALLTEHWEYSLERAPEMASTLGDRRYNDRWSDRSLEAITADLAKTKDFLARFEAISTAGFPEQSALDHQIIVRQLRQWIDDARFEEWLMPVNQFGGVHLRLPSLVAQLPFATVKDYEDYVARLTAVPAVFEVVSFFHDHSTIDEPSVQAETDRYIANPGQALGYKIGQLTISRLRAHAKDELGQAFDVRAFHDEVLGAGALPLDLLEHRINAWIERRKGAPAATR